MSVLPVGRSLVQFFPDLEDLLRNPSSYLQARPVEIGPRQAYGFAALFGTFAAAFFIACAVSGVWRDERFLLGIGLSIGSAVWLGWSLRLRGHSLVLRPDGVEIRYRDSVVWCPWSLFNADGAPLVPEGDNPRAALLLPVAAEAVPFVELRRNEAPVAHGSRIKVPQLHFTSPDQLVLTARYEIAAADLGTLLLQLGGRLGARLPRGSPLPDATSGAEPVLADVTGPDAGGWYTVPLARLQFPPRCSDCGQPTEAAVNASLGDADVAGRVTGMARSSELAVPLCQDCQGRMRLAYQRGGVRGLNAGAVLGLIAAAGLAAAQGEREPVPLALAGLVGALIGALIGFLAGSGLAQPLPVQFRRYRPDLGTLQIRFRDPAYADHVLAASSRKQSR
jgi:hypothetical protein